MMTFDAVDVFPERLTQMEGWEDYITDFDEEEHAPLLGYLEDVCGLHCFANVGDLPSVSTFRDMFRGEWDSFEEYAADLVEECGYFGDCSDFLRSYFDYEKFANDLAFDYSVADAPGLKVWVYEAF